MSYLYTVKMREMKINFKTLSIGVLAIVMVAGLMNGTIQKFVYFADPLNEMFTALVFGVMGVGFVMSSFEKKVSNI